MTLATFGTQDTGSIAHNIQDDDKQSKKTQPNTENKEDELHGPHQKRRGVNPCAREGLAVYRISAIICVPICILHRKTFFHKER